MNEEQKNTNQAQGSQQAGRTVTEEFRVSGEAVVGKVKELVREGNVRRITIKNDEGKVLIEIPLTIGVVGAVLLPVWAAISAIAALVANLTISVEKVADTTTQPTNPVPSTTQPSTTTGNGTSADGSGSDIILP